MTNYVKTNSLTSESPGLVKLDSLLSEICTGKTEVKWEELQQAIMSKMSPGYSLQFADKPPMVFKGKLDSIELSVATRSGNKKVTLINNLDTYQVERNGLKSRVLESLRVSFRLLDQTILFCGNQSIFCSDKSRGVRPQVPSVSVSRYELPPCSQQKVRD